MLWIYPLKFNLSLRKIPKCFSQEKATNFFLLNVTQVSLIPRFSRKENLAILKSCEWLFMSEFNWIFHRKAQLFMTWRSLYNSHSDLLKTCEKKLFAIRKNVKSRLNMSGESLMHIKTWEGPEQILVVLQILTTPNMWSDL